VLGPEADRYFEQAAELSEDDRERAGLFEQAGRALSKSGDAEAAEKRLRSAVALYQESGVPTGGRAAVRLAGLLRHQLGQIELARELLEPFRQSTEGTDRVVRAEALAELAATLAFGGELDAALPVLEDALTTLEYEQAWGALADALVTRGIYLIWRGRLEEGRGVLRHAMTLAESNEAVDVALRARGNLAQVSLESDRLADAVDEANESVALARERGDREFERKGRGLLVWPLETLGRWDEAISVGSVLLAEEGYLDAIFAAASLVSIAYARGDDATIERCRSLAASAVESTYVDRRICADIVRAREAIERGALDVALRHVRGGIHHPSLSGDALRQVYAHAVEAAIALRDKASMSELEAFVAELPPARATPLLRAGRARIQAAFAHQAGDVTVVERCENEAIALLRSVGARPLLAKTLLEQAQRRGDEDALLEARSIYEELGAVRWLARLEPQIGVTA
jgi:tetratricopeptide (TPR) repeat protein